MEYLVKRGTMASEKSTCAILPIYANKRLSEDAKAIDKLYKGIISSAVRNGDIKGNLGETLLVQTPNTAIHKRILLVGCGKSTELTILKFKRIIQSIAAALKSTGATDATSSLTSLEIKDQTARALTRNHVLTIEDSYYQYEHTLSKEKPAPKLKRVKFVCTQAQLKQTQLGAKQGKAIASGMLISKELGNLPGNICTPTHLAKTAQIIKRGKSKLTVDILDEKAMQKLGMGSLLSVSAGSVEPAKLICLQYKGAAKSSKPVVLVGKGITFDTGGISLKPGAAMDEMKFDMCGAASVLGTMQAVAELALPINVVGVVASAENMPGGKATKPGDVVTSMSGQTIEILNTDAEGRLVLCDALTYIAKYNPDVVIDVATLTGACVVALGHEATGLMSNSEKLSDDLLEAGKASGDRAWPLPIWEEYQSQLSSNFADMANIGGRWGGTITAACFLSRFTKDYKWAHLDIAGTAWYQGKNKGATGRPVPLLTEFLMQKARVA